MNKENAGEGHRARLKTRFNKSPIRTLPDYEILEMILFNAIARRDTKALAKSLLSKYNSLIAVISADPEDLLLIKGINHAVILQFKLLLDLFTRFHISSSLKTFSVINNWNAVLNYCTLTMGFKSKEHFRILFLNKRNILLADEILETGTIDKVMIYPREIVKKCLYYNAAAIVLVHNHPSGEAKPSKADIEITQKIAHALEHMNISIHDHIIVAHDNHFSFKGNRLI